MQLTATLTGETLSELQTEARNLLTMLDAQAIGGQDINVSIETIGQPPKSDGDTADDTPNADSLQVDVRGICWDERIHSATPTYTKTGEWRAKRGVDKKLLADITAELMAATLTSPPEPGAITAPTAPPLTLAPPVVTPAPEVALSTAVADTLDLATQLVANAGEAATEVSRELHNLLVNAGLANGTQDLMKNEQWCPWVDQQVREIANKRRISLA